MDAPKVSIVIPTKNRPLLFSRSLESVLAQDYANIEIVIVDDSDDDLTKNIVAKYAEDKRIAYYKVSGLNAKVKSCNYGLEMSRGDYISFLDDDDEYKYNKTTSQVEILASNPDVDLVHCWVEYITADGRIAGYQKKVGDGYIYPDIIAKTLVGGTNAIMLRRRLYESVGGFNEKMKYYDDREWYARLMKSAKVRVLPYVLVVMHADHGMVRMTDDNNAANLLAATEYLYIYAMHKNVLRKYPSLRTIMLSKIASSYSKGGSFVLSTKYYCKAIFSSVAGIRVLKPLLKDALFMLRVGHRRRKCGAS